MTSTPFQWNPNEDQTYTTRDGSQRLTGIFDKVCGKSFTMDAPNQRLALDIDARAASVWGGRCTSPTAINLVDGTLNIGGEDVRLFIRGTDMTLQGRGYLGANVAIYEAGSLDSPNRFNLTEWSTIDVTCSKSYSAVGSIDIQYAAKMAVRSPVIKLEACQILLATAGGYHPLMLLESTTGTGQDDQALMHVRNTAITCTGNTVATMTVPHASKLTIVDSVISVSGSAAVNIEADNLLFSRMDTTRFEVSGSGPCTISFHGTAPDTQPFDFVNNIYPQGLFRFSRKGGNQGSLSFANCGNLFQYKAMLDHKVVYIDEQPAGQDMLLYRFTRDKDLVIKMK